MFQYNENWPRFTAYFPWIYFLKENHFILRSSIAKHGILLVNQHSLRSPTWKPYMTPREAGIVTEIWPIYLL